MLLLFLGLNLVSFILVECKDEIYSEESEDDLGNKLADTLTKNAGRDVSGDEEYEDLRAEFLAYRTALASIANIKEPSRRSLITTPCWKLNGICINYKLCKGFRSLSEVPGCKDKLKVCCFVWDRYNVRDWKSFGIDNLAMPWKGQVEFGGLGVVDKTTTERVKLKKSKAKKKKEKEDKTYNSKNSRRDRAIAIIIRSS